MEKITTALKALKTVNKFIVALVASLTVYLSVVEGGVTVDEWVTVGLAFAGAIGVYAIPNKKS